MESLKYVKVEQYDVDMMDALASHEGVSNDVKKILKSYKRLRHDGNKVQIVYEYGKDMKTSKIGRVYPQKGLGLQSFPSDVRSCLAQKYYWEPDMVNAQPVILLQLSKKHGWKCDELEEFVFNRSAKLNEIMEALECDRQEAKEVCISLMFGGNPYKKMPEFVTRLAIELKVIGVEIVQAYPDILKLCLKKPNSFASTTAHVIQNIEFTILQAMDTAFTKYGRNMDVLIHDGGLVRKLDGEKKFPKELLQLVQKDVLDNTGYDIKLSEKPLTHTFTFKKDILRVKFVTETEYQKRKEEFEESHFYCTNTDAVYTVLESSLNATSRSSCSAAFSYYNFQKEIKGTIQTIDFMQEWMKDPVKRTVDKLIFYPDVNYELPNTYNIFNGLKGSIPVECCESEAVVERFKELLYHNAGKNDKMNEYLLKWFALTVQKPYVVPGVAIVLINTEQGTGKETLSEFFGKQVIGHTYYKNIKNVETELFDKHSNALNGTLFLKLEEVNGSLNRKWSDLLKAMITSTSVTINPKNVNPYTIDAFPHQLMTTNNSVPVKVEKSDRRFCISYTSSDYLGNFKFWDETYRLFELEGAGHSVYQYLMSIDLTSFKVQNFYKSDYHENLAVSEVPSEVLFMEQVEPFTDLRATQLHRMYTDYCIEQSFTAKGCVHFARALSPLMERNIVTKRCKHGCSLYSKNEISAVPTIETVVPAMICPPQRQRIIIPKLKTKLEDL
jgi:hypothetical protein